MSRQSRFPQHLFSSWFNFNRASSSSSSSTMLDRHIARLRSDRIHVDVDHSPQSPPQSTDHTHDRVQQDTRIHEALSSTSENDISNNRRGRSSNSLQSRSSIASVNVEHSRNPPPPNDENDNNADPRSDNVDTTAAAAAEEVDIESGLERPIPPTDSELSDDVHDDDEAEEDQPPGDASLSQSSSSPLCLLFVSFVLFRLWVVAIQESDVGLMLICLLATSWTARWIQYNREREEHAAAMELQNQPPSRRSASGSTVNTTLNGDGDDNDLTMDQRDLRMLSFQAQLALAIMESQRHMMQGGLGGGGAGSSDHASLSNSTGGGGVSAANRARWTYFKYSSSRSSSSDHHDDDDGTKMKNHPLSQNHHHGYGSVGHHDKDDLDPDDASLPQCSICLCEYEDGEALVKLPCGNVFHQECIHNWTAHHTKCPLCNFEMQQQSHSSPPSRRSATTTTTTTTAATPRTTTTRGATTATVIPMGSSD